MSELLAIRDKVIDFLRKFDEITTPIFRFVASLIMFNTINSLFGYSDLFEKNIVVILLSIISALVSNAVVVFLGGAVILVNVLSVSTEVALAFAVLFIVMYCMYMRMFPECSWVIALVPILYTLNLEYAAPIIIMMFAGISGIIPAAFGVLIYYFANATKEINSMVTLAASEEEVKAFKYLVDNVLKNKELLLIIVAFAAVIAVSYVVYHLPVDFAFYIGIVTAGVLNIICFPVCSGILKVGGVEFGSLIFGSLIGILIAAIAQMCKGILDYAKKEVVQFEDDDYYYYVKAVPKFNTRNKLQPKDIANKEIGNVDNDEVRNNIKQKRQNPNRDIDSELENKVDNTVKENRKN